MQITVVINSFLVVGISFQWYVLTKINVILLTYFLEVLKQKTSLTLGFVDVIAVGQLGRHSNIMAFSVEDRLLIKNVQECKGYGANKLAKQFPGKG